METPGTITVARSFPRLIVKLVLGLLMMTVGLCAIVGPGTILYAWLAIGTVLSVFCLVVAGIGRRPRVKITPEGFTFYRIVGSRVRRWEDIEGAFEVIKIGFSEAVGYRLTADFKTRTGTKPETRLSGCDEAIMMTFPIPTAEMVRMLNARGR